MSGGSAPGPSALTQQLQAEQAGLLRFQRSILEEQFRLDKLLQPFLFEQLGFEAIRDENGKITGFKPTKQGQARQDIQTALLERSRKALAGELDISPTLERELGERSVGERERLRRQFGPDFESSTPGAEALTNLSQSDIEIREGARFGQLTLNEQLSLARGNQNQSTGSVARGLTLPAGFGGLQNLTSQFGSPISAGIGQQQIAGQFGNQLSSLEQILIAGAGGAAAIGLSALL